VDIIPTGERRHMVGAPESIRSSPYKINDVYLESPTLRRALAKLGPQVETFLGGRGCIVNSLHFERGSEQGIHTDLFYMPAKTRGSMCAAWIALEDVHELAGPLVYFPGSHLIEPPIDYWGLGPDERIAQTENCMRHYWNHVGTPELNAGMRAGDVFFWHEGLIHGGAPIADKAKTRRSVVIHFWISNEVPGAVIPINGKLNYWARPHQPVSASTPAYTKAGA
jgi:ectoine hydroxylase-related dioxygenase (phytanoyl-CoA dioxygenase family)